MTALREIRHPDRASVIVAYDGSEQARRALVHAAAIVGPGRRVTVVNVIPAQAVSSRLETVSAEERERQDRLLEEAQDVLVRRGVGAILVGAAGDPLTEILAAVERAGATTLAVGRSARRRLNGHLGDRLVRRARCDVLVVH